MCLNSEDQARSLCTNPTETPEQCLLCHPWTAAQTPVPPAQGTGQAGGRQVQGGQLSRAESGQSEHDPHTWHMSCWLSNPIWAATPEGKEHHNTVIKLVLWCQSCSYPQRRWNHLTNTACLPPSPILWSVCHHSPDPQTAEERINVGKAQDSGGGARAGLKLCCYVLPIQKWP